jgi:hypothetical protein
MISNNGDQFLKEGRPQLLLVDGPLAQSKNFPLKKKTIQLNKDILGYVV